MKHHEEIYEVCWKGPYSDEQLSELSKEENQNFVLYKIYGSHPVYGDNVLLYIGMTEQGVKKRLTQHDYWMDEERFGPSKIFFASIGKFESWEKSDDFEIFEKPDRETIKKVESLLIYAHQPVHNQKSRGSAKKAKNIRIFNTMAFGMLMPEISGFYQNC